MSGTGNEANQRHHYQGKIEALTERREIELQVGTGVDAFSMELWAELPNLIAVSVISPSGEVLPRIFLPATLRSNSRPALQNPALHY